MTILSSLERLAGTLTTPQRRPRCLALGYRANRMYITVGFQPDEGIIPCALERKRPRRLVPRRKNGIVSVEYLAHPVRGKCIQVENKDGIYLIGEKFIPTHNSLLASDAGPAWALGNWPWMKFVLASYSDELPIDFSRNIRAQLQSPEYRQIFPNGAHLS
jgi:hypothetical protein